MKRLRWIIGLMALLGLALSCSSDEQESLEASSPAPAGHETRGGDRTAAENDALAAPADVAAPPTGAKKTASGLAYMILSEGRAVHPQRRQTRSRCTTPVGPRTARCSTAQSSGGAPPPSD